ncbi:MAG: GtrA family protein [Christensenellaceae bacterium]|jgi:putative flippase GtrA|nr:GtrA family protein [Christensenellaceae bacterium]
MEKLREWFLQAVKFGLVGVLNTAIDYSAFWLLTLLPFFKANYLLAQVISYGLGLCNSLFFNKRWTFAQKSKMSGAQLAGFLAVNLAALGVSSGVMYLLREGLFMNLYGAKLIATVFSMGVNFVGSKLLVFKTKEGAA